MVIDTPSPAAGHFPFRRRAAAAMIIDAAAFATLHDVSAAIRLCMLPLFRYCASRLVGTARQPLSPPNFQVFRLLIIRHVVARVLHCCYGVRRATMRHAPAAIRRRHVTTPLKSHCRHATGD